MSRFLTPLRIHFIMLLASGSVLYFFANIQRVAVPEAVFDRLQQFYNCDTVGDIKQFSSLSDIMNKAPIIQQWKMRKNPMQTYRQVLQHF